VTFAIIGALVLPVTAWVKHIISLTADRPTLMDLIFKHEDYVHAIISHMKQTSFQPIGLTNTIILPNNSLFLPSSIATSIVLLSIYCHNKYGTRKTPMFHYDHDTWDAQDHNFISVGGPFVNPLVKSILDSKKIPEFLIDQIPTALDKGTRYQAERENTAAQDAPIIKDYGFIIYMQNPYNPAKKICILFGLWPQGTQGAVETILGQANRSALFNQFYRYVRKGQDVIGVVQVTVTGLLVGKAEIIKFRSF